MKDKQKHKELDWEELWDWCCTEVMRLDNGEDVWEQINKVHKQTLSYQRQEILGEVLKTIGKVKFYKCKDTESVDYGEMIPCERIDIDELREEIKSLKQNEK